MQIYIGRHFVIFNSPRNYGFNKTWMYLGHLLLPSMEV